MKKYYSLPELIEMMNEPYRSICLKILKENEELFKTVQGAVHNHQAWPGGYYNHVEEVMNIAVVVYPVFRALRPLPFTLSDALLILFLHDIEKPWKYELKENGSLEIKPSLEAKEDQHAFRAQKLEDYGIVLNENQANAMKYVEGEYKDYSPKKRVMNELTAFCHICDVSSARIWYDHPLDYGDPWTGSKRIEKL
jgi:hypothetical protein